MNAHPYAQLFENTSFGIAHFDINSLKLEMANDAVLDLWGKDKSVLNLPLLDFLPELADQPYPMIMEEVAKTGKTYTENGAEVLLRKNGITESVFMDYSYIPVMGPYNKVTSLVVMAKGICQRQLNKMVNTGIEKNLQSMVLTAPVPMGVFTGPNLEMRVVNEMMLDLWCDHQWFGRKELIHVYHNGMPYTLQTGNVTYCFTPLVDFFGKVNGVSVIAKLN